MPDTVAGDSSTTANLGVGSSVNGTIETNGDHDWYRITLTAGTAYSFRLSQPASGAILDPTLTLRDASGVEVRYNDDADGYYSIINFTATQNGTFYLDVAGWNEDYTGNFILTASVRPPIPVYSNDEIAGQLIYGGGSETASHFAVTTGGSLTVNFAGLTAAGQTLARLALDLWTDATGINFIETSGGASITFDDEEEGAYSTQTGTAGGIITSAFINVETLWLSTYGTGINTYSMQTYVHEIGHALGLEHPGDYNGTAIYPDDAIFQNDSWATSVMSYFDQDENEYFSNLGFSRGFVLSPMAADHLAVQQLYGMPSTTRAGDTVYGFNSTAGRPIYDAVQVPQAHYTIYDSGGTDTLDYSGYAQDQTIILAAENFFNVGGRIGNVVIARGTVIENARAGSGNDQLYGNSVANFLSGGAGNDYLSGGSGADVMDGGVGDDIFIVDEVGDSIIEAVGGGYDGVYSNTSAPYILTAGAEVEVLATYGSGNIDLYGNEFGQSIWGGTGNNYLSGGAGADAMVGLTGNDSYIVDNVGDYVIETAGEGFDAVYTNVTHFLYAGSQVELLATYGITGNIDLYGNEFAQSIYGGAGHNYINGGGGADAMRGLGGNDSYIVDNGGDQVFENAGEGSDVVYTNTSYSLAAGSEIEVLATYGSGGAVVLQGNEFGQNIYGGAGADILRGNGGNDYITGNGGNDIAEFAGLMSSYTITVNGGVATVVDNDAAADGNDGSDTIYSVETLRFKNGETFSVSGQAASSASPAKAEVSRQLMQMAQDMASFGGNGGEGLSERAGARQSFDSSAFYALS